MAVGEVSARYEKPFIRDISEQDHAQTIKLFRVNVFGESLHEPLR